jgi:two-component system, response regulator PdtaR
MVTGRQASPVVSVGIEGQMSRLATPRWRLVVIDDHSPSRALVLATVTALGGAVVAESMTAAGTLELLGRVRPDAVVLAVGLPDGDGVELAGDIMGTAPCPIVLLTSRADSTVIRRASLAGAMAYLVKPLRPEELEPAIELAIARFGELVRASAETETLRRALADRKRIEQAKGVLQQRLGVTEAEAFALLRKTAMDRRVTLAALADSVIKGGETLDQRWRR